MGSPSPTRAASALLVLLQAALCGQDKASVTISVASSLRMPMEEVKAAFERQHPETRIVHNFGSSGALQQQIEQGAPVDVFLPASPRQMDALEAKGLIVKATRRDLLVNEVVLIAPRGTSSPASFEDLKAIQLLALGDPASVPAGEYGQQVLRFLGLWPAVESKLILAKDVRQVLATVESGNADAGLVYASDARGSEKVRVVASAPPGSHAPIVYPVAVLSGAAGSSAAREFALFLSAESSREIFARYGLLSGTPGSPILANQATLAPLDLSPIWISIQTSIAATALTFVLGLFAAYRMRRYQGPGRYLIDGLLTLPLVLPPTVIGFFLLLLFGKNGPLGQFLQSLGWTIVFSWPATVIAATVVAFPMMYRASLGALEQVTPTLLQAARTLGASEWRVFREVTLPLAWPGILAGTVLAFARALGEFGATLMLAGNIPGRTQTMPLAIFFAAEGGEMDRALGWVLLIVAISLAAIALLGYWSRYRPVASPAPAPDSSEAERPPTAYRVARQSGIESSKDLEFDVHAQAGEFSLRASFHLRGGPLGLLGASGAGKSMTLRCIAGIETPESGRIVLNGRVLFDRAAGIDIPPSDRGIGVLFQDYALFPHMTVRENIAFGLHALAPAEQQTRIGEVLALVRLEGLADRRPPELSGGQKQRAALARALATRPDALLLDEPFSALDPHLRRQLENQLREALAGYEGVAVFVTHDMEEAFRFCQDLIVLESGHVIASGPRSQLFEQPGTISAARLTGCKNIAAAKPSGDGAIEVPGWGVVLRAGRPVARDLTHVGIRAHHMRIVPTGGAHGPNAFPCWLRQTSESPHEITLYLQFRDIALGLDPAHLELEVSKELWKDLQSRPQPWLVELPPARILLLAS